MLFGLHWIDASILFAYIIAVLVIGEYLSRRVKDEREFFLAGRKLGKFFQFFLNFGNMAGDPSSAAISAASVYKDGVGGVWLGLITLFTTPYYWFMNPWFRRVRLTTIADLFEDRFGQRWLASLYAIVTIVLAPIGLGFGNVIALKTLQPVICKPVAEYTVQEQQMVRDFSEYVALRKERQVRALSPEQQERYESLKGRHNRGVLSSYVSYLKPVPFYLCSSLLVCIFIMLGGLKASAVIDAIQSVLIVVISVMLIPFGLSKIGGAHALHESVPDYMFQIFGSTATSEFTWYSIAAFLLLNYISCNGVQGNMNVAGSAKNEMAARLGAVGGGFAKRFVTIAWCYCGLMALALFGPSLSDPDQTWGLLTRSLLPVGFIGIMLVGMLGGKMASLGTASVVFSALTVRNIYEPLFPGKSERHYMIVARLTVPILLLQGISVALFMSDAVSLAKSLATFGVIWGAPILLIFIWRRLTETAVRVQVIACLLILVVIPYTLSAIPAIRRAPALTGMTQEQIIPVQCKATRSDVAAGLASSVGALIVKPHHIESVALFFEEGVAQADPSDPHSPREGLGRFNMELYVASLLGVNLERWTPPQLLTLRFLMDCALPFLLLIPLSYLTRATDMAIVDRFYAKMKTPVGETPEADQTAVELSYAQPERFDHVKLFPRSNWEFCRWDRADTIGFLACCAGVVIVLVFFKVVVQIGSPA